jgi:uncharacterized repeat protein (TIGR01451 family)
MFKQIARIAVLLCAAMAFAVPLAAQSVDLAVTGITDSPNDITLGTGNVQYFINTFNSSGSAATNAQLTANLPASSTFVSASAPGGATCNESGGVVTCTWATYGSGASFTTTITVTPGAAGTNILSAGISANEADPVPGNNNDSETTTVNDQIDLAVFSIGDNPNDITLGTGNVQYSISMYNYSTSKATNAVLTVNLPASSTYVSGSVTVGTCSESGGVVTCTIGDYPSGASYSATITVTPGAAGTNTLNASIAATQPDPDNTTPGHLATDSETTTVNDQIDLAVFSIGDNPNDITLGTGNVQYSISMYNYSSSKATGAVLTVNLPASSTYVSGSVTVGTCNESGGVVTCTIGDYPSGASYSATITVTPGAAGTNTLSASIAATQPDPDNTTPGHLATDSETTTVNDQIDLAVFSITDNPNDITLGTGNVQYSISMYNYSTSKATGTVLTVNLPASSTYVSGTVTVGTCSHSAGVVTCTIGDYPSGASYSATITVTPGAAGTNTLSAAIAATQPDPDNTTPGHLATDSEITTVNDQIDLAVFSITDFPNDITLGTGNVQYSISMYNYSTSKATGTVLTVNLPASSTYVSGTVTVGSCSHSAGVVTCTIGDYPSGASYSATITVTPGAAGTNTLSASIAATQPDPDNTTPGHLATDTETTTVNDQIDLAVFSITDFPNDITLGTGNVQYSISMYNYSTSKATGTVLTVNLPASSTYVSGTVTVGSCSHSAGVVTCTIGDYPSGASYSATITVTPGAAGTNTLNASIAATQPDPDNTTPSHLATDSETTTVNDQIDLAVFSITDSPDPRTLGAGNVQYFVSMYNYSTSKATGTVLTANLPTSSTFVSATVTVGSCSHSAGVVTCTIGDYPSGASYSSTITVTPGVAGTNTLSATISATQPDPDNTTASHLATDTETTTVNPNVAPVISSFTPGNGPATTSVVLTGSAFTGTTSVKFNGTSTTFTVVNDTTINTTVPAGATSGPISVTNGIGTGSSATSFFTDNSVHWINSSGGNWSTAANWSGGSVPISTDTVAIDATGTYTVTLDTHATVAGLTLGAASGSQTLSNAAFTLTLNGASSVAATGTLSTAGTLTGTGTLTVAGTMNWSAGSVTGTGPLNISSGGFFNINGSAAKSFSTRTIGNSGTTTWTGTGNINSGLGAVFNNLSGGTLNIQTDAALLYNLGGTQTVLTNSANVVKSATTGINDVGWIVNNNGTTSIQTGSIKLTAGGGGTGTYNISSGAALKIFTGTYTFGSTASFTGAGTLDLLSGTVTHAGTYTVAGPLNVAATFNLNNTAPVTLTDVTLSSGSLGGTGSYSSAGTFNWTGGSITGTGTLTINNGSALNISGTNSKTFSQRTIVNNGTTTWSGTGNINSGIGAVFTNSAGKTFAIQNDASLFYNLGGTQAVFNNLGSVVKSVATGVSTLTCVFNNDSLLDLQSGSVRLSAGGTSSGLYAVASGAVLRFDGGTHTLTGTPAINGAGTVDFEGGTINVNGAYALAGAPTVSGGAVALASITAFGTPLTVSGGSIAFNQAAVLALTDVDLSGGTFGGTGPVTVSGTFGWSGGTITGTGTLGINGGAALNIGSASTKTFSQKTINNSGTTTWASGNINSGLSAVFNNLAGATFSIQTDSSAFYNLGGTQTVFNNSGSVVKSSSFGTSTIDWVFNNNNSLDVQSGIFRPNAGGTSSGTYTAGSGATMQFGGTHTLSGTSLMTGAGTFDFPSGTVTSSGGFTVTGTANITGGTLTLNNTAPVTFSDLNLSNGQLGGTGNWTLAGTFDWTGGTLTGTGTLTVNSGSNLNLSGASTKTFSQRTIANSGTTTWSGTGSINSGLSAVFNNLSGGTFAIQNDASLFYNLGGTQTVLNNSASVVKSIGTGTTAVGWVVNNNGTIDVQTGTLKLSGGGTSSGTYNAGSGATLNFGGGTHTLSAASSITGAGTGIFEIGTVTTAGTCTVFQVNITGATLQLNNASPLTLSNVTFSGGTLTGTGDWSLTGGFLWSGGTITGTGTLSIDAGASLSIIGSLTKIFSQRTIDNAGTTSWFGTGNINSGLGAIFNNQPGGIFLIQNDASLFYNLGGTQTVFNNNGTLSKSSATGTSSWSVALNNQGLLEVSSGIFNPTSTFAQTSTGTLRIDIAGLTAGTQYGRLAVNGAAPLDGTLTVNLIGGFTPTLGDTFQIATFASHTGDFATKTGLLYPGGSFSYAINPTNVTLTAGAAVNTLTVDSINDSGAGTLRQAMEDAEAGNCASPCTIQFNIGVTPHINLQSVLPPITVANLTIDGRTQPGYAGTPLVMIYGTGCTICNAPVIDLQGVGGTIAGLSIVDFPDTAIALGGTGATVINNYIGVKTDGVSVDGNGHPAVLISGASNVIGGTTAAARNVISGNAGAGIMLLGATATGNQIKGNYIGISPAGNAAMPNGFDAIQILDGATNNVVGGPSAGDRNVLSGNLNSGVYINETVVVGSVVAASVTVSSVSGNVIQGNYIGTDAAGLVAVGNANGVYLSGAATGNIIGGTGAGEGNVIAGNTTYGIALLGNATGTIIEGNKIGANAAGAALGNGIGVSMQPGSANTHIESNVVAFNVTEGLKVSPASTGNHFLGNSIHDNAGIGIDLNENGLLDTNDTGDGDSGGNGTQNSPAITSAVVSGGTLTLVFNLDSSATASTNVRVEFFESDGAGEGETFLGAACVDANTFSSGTSIPAGSVVPGDQIVATATGFTGTCASQGSTPDGTSEFSAPFAAICPPVIVSITPSGPTTFCAGGSVTLTATAGYTYSWSNGATTQAITVNTSGTYTVIATNASGCSASAQATVTVNPNPPTPAITPSGPTTFCAGGSVTLSAPGGYAGYSWSNGATTAAINVTASGTFTVTVTDANGCSATSAATTVTVNPTPTATITPSGPTTFCTGGSVTLNAPAGMTTYAWSNGASTPSIVVNASGTFTVTVTNASGCSATSAPTTVAVNAPPAATITPSGPTNLCTGGTVTLTAPAGMATYAWSNGGSTQSIVVNVSGNYSVTVTDANGCSATSAATAVTVNPAPTATITPSGPTTFCTGGSVTLSAPAGMTTYAWSNGASTPSINVTSSGTFTVTVTDGNGCTATSSATTVTVNPAPIATITPSGPTTFCAGGSVTLTAPAGMQSYNWSNGATSQSIVVTSSGSFSVTLTNPQGCSATSAATAVTVNPAPVATITPSGPTTFCNGGSVTLTAPAGMSAYNWSNGATTQSIAVNTSGSFTVTVTNGSGCSTTSAPTTVNTNGAPPVSITPSGPTSFCTGGSVTLTATPGFTGYNWSNGATTQSITVTNSGTFTVTATTGAGCSSTSSAVTVTVSSSAGTVYITAPGAVNAGSTGNTASVPAGPGGTTYSWSIGNGTITSGNGTPSITFTAGSSGTVGLSVSVVSGACTSTGNASVSINALADLKATMSASPNPVAGGGTITFTINVANAGPNAAQGVSAIGNIFGATFAGASGAGWSCSGSNPVNCTIASLPIGNAAPLTITATAGQGPGTATGDVVLISASSDPNGNDNSANASVTIGGQQPSCNSVAPSITAPAGQAIGSPATFTWTPSANAVGYDLWIAVGNAPASIVLSTTSTTATVSLPAGPISAFVGARFDACPTLVSQTKSFTVTAAPNCNNAKAQLSAPLGGVVASPVTFSWLAAPQAIGYRVWVEIDGAGAQDVATTNGATSATVALVGNSVKWSVESLFSACTSTFSDPATFQLAAVDACASHQQAQLVAPANNSTAASSEITFDWNAVPDADGYRVWASVDGAPFAVIGITTNDTILETIIGHGIVDWYVEVEFNGCPSTESERRIVTVPSAQSCNNAAPTNLAPSNATLGSNAVDFTWNAAPNAIGYEVWLGLKGAVPALIGTTTATTFHATVFAGELEWFVRALFNGCDAVDSAHAFFVFAPPANCTATAPILVTPFDGAPLVSPVDFTFSAVTGATQYRLIIDGVQIATTTVPHFAGVSIANGVHEWLVEAAFNGCPPLRSTAGTFTVVPAPPPCANPAIPELRANATASTGVTYVVHLTPLPNATYELQESTSPSFAGAVSLTSPAPAFPRVHVNNGAVPQVYYYRARAINKCNGNRSLFSPAITVTILPPATNDPTQTNGSTPVDNPQATHYTIHLGGTGASSNDAGIVAAAEGTPFSATTNMPWLKVTPSTGVVPAGGIDLDVTADAKGLPVGTSTGAVDVTLGAAGTSSNKVKPADGTSTTTTTVSVNLVAPVSATPKSGPPPDALVIPAVAHAAGVNSQFQSDVRLTNTAAQTVKYQVTFTPSGEAGNKSGLQTALSVEPGRTIALDDILQTWFGEQSATGTIEIRPLTVTAATTSSKAVTGLPNLTTFAASRTFNTTANGTFGQYIPAIPFANFVARNGAAISLQQIAQSPAYRTNLGIVEGSGEPATALITVFGSNGTKLTDFTQALKGGQHLQMNAVLASKGITVDDGRIEVKVISGNGKLTAYASVLNNETNDPLLVAPANVSASGASKYVIPGVADLNNGFANWQTDVRVFNAAATAVNATATFYPQSGEPASVPLPIAPGEVKVLDGVLNKLFGVTNTGGAVHITTTSNTSLVASARTYNLTTAGTYGQFIGAVTPNEAAALGTRSLQLLQIEESSRYRSNVGVLEIGGKPVKVEIGIIPPDSKIAATTTVDLAPNQFIQFNQLLKSAGFGDDVYNARVTLRVIEGQGRITGYASVVDMLTNDPTYVNAQ